MVLIIDEMKIRDDFVYMYDWSGSHLHGFVNLGDINNELLEMEQRALRDKPPDHIASQVLTLMVRAILIKLEFPYATFPTQGTSIIYLYKSGVCAYSVIWGIMFHRCHG